MSRPTETLDELRSRPHWSYTAINQWARICSAQFAFQRVHGLRRAFVTEAIPFGAAFHRAAEGLWRARARGRDRSARSLADSFSRHWRREVRTCENLVYRRGDFDSHRAAGRAMIAAYREGVGDLGEVLGINVPFAAQLVDADGVVSDRPVIGEFDLLLAGDDGAVTVVDLKTAGQRYSESRIASDLQATVYLLALAQMFPRARRQFRWDVVLKLKTPRLEQHFARRGPADFARLGELVKLMERSVAAGLFVPNEGSFYCDGCGFAELCRTNDWLAAGGQPTRCSRLTTPDT